MVNVDSILSRERDNKSAIYLYEGGDRWFAYEHSAYHFFQIFKMGEIVQVGNRICVAVSNRFDFLQTKAMSSVKITSVADTEVKIDCTTAFAGFEQWKEELLSSMK